MKESKAQARLRAMKIYNNHGLLMRFGLPGDGVVEYRPAQLGHECSKTVVWSPLPYGKLPNWSKDVIGRRSESFDKALGYYISKIRKCDPHEMMPSPFGGLVHKDVLRKALAAASDHKAGIAA